MMRWWFGRMRLASQIMSSEKKKIWRNKEAIFRGTKAGAPHNISQQQRIARCLWRWGCPWCSGQLPAGCPCPKNKSLPVVHGNRVRLPGFLPRGQGLRILQKKCWFSSGARLLFFPKKCCWGTPAPGLGKRASLFHQKNTFFFPEYVMRRAGILPNHKCLIIPSQKNAYFILQRSWGAGVSPYHQCFIISSEKNADYFLKK